MPRSCPHDYSPVEKVWLGRAGYLVTTMTQSIDIVRFPFRRLIIVHLKQIEELKQKFVQGRFVEDFNYPCASDKIHTVTCPISYLGSIKDEKSNLLSHWHPVPKCKCRECNTFTMVRIHVQI